jgi:two-component system LytT family response regulator
MKHQYRAVIIDDEELAREELQLMLAEYPEIKVVAEADSVQKGIEVIENLKPDVVFLDIQMPGGSGFDLLNQIEVSFNFKLIFVSAYDEYAIRAFEVNALDYLLKPVHPNRLRNAINRLFANIDDVNINTEKTDRKEVRKLEYDDRFFLNIDNRSRFLKINAIKCICAEGNYSEIITADDKKSLVIISLKEWEERLPDKYFVRIHRSTIINLEYVEKVEKWFKHSFQVYLRHLNEPFIMSRRYAAKLKKKLKLRLDE